jgi:DNA-binding response OmpR family regulator
LLEILQGAEAPNDQARPCVLLVQADPAPGLAILIEHDGYEVAGPFDSLSQASDWLDADTPDAAILDITVHDGACFDLARDLRRRGVPFLFYTTWDDIEQIPVEFREDGFLQRPDHAILIPKLLARMVQEARQAA